MFKFYERYKATIKNILIIFWAVFMLCGFMASFANKQRRRDKIEQLENKIELLNSENKKLNNGE
jgi:hypothetical protein